MTVRDFGCVLNAFHAENLSGGPKVTALLQFRSRLRNFKHYCGMAIRLALIFQSVGKKFDG